MKANCINCGNVVVRKQNMICSKCGLICIERIELNEKQHGQSYSLLEELQEKLKNGSKKDLIQQQKKIDKYSENIVNEILPIFRSENVHPEIFLYIMSQILVYTMKCFSYDENELIVKLINHMNLFLMDEKKINMDKIVEMFQVIKQRKNDIIDDFGTSEDN